MLAKSAFSDDSEDTEADNLRYFVPNGTPCFVTDIPCGLGCSSEAEEVVDGIQDETHLEASGEEVPDEFCFALVGVCVAQSAVLLPKRFLERLLVCLVGNLGQSFRYLIRVQAHVAKHLTDFHLAPMVVAELVVGVGSAETTVVDEMFRRETLDVLLHRPVTKRSLSN